MANLLLLKLNGDTLNRLFSSKLKKIRELAIVQQTY